jgi:hypothetical protein
MKKINGRNAIGFSPDSLALITGSIFVAVNSAIAKEHKPNLSANESQVVAHVSLKGQTAIDMALQRQVNNKLYLYVQHSKDEGISVIDVTQPKKPKVLGIVSWPNPTVASQMNMTGSLGIITERAAAPNHDKTLPDLVMWDLSNPVSPRAVQQFSGVVRWFEDERDFIYVLNGDGLWVISTPVDQQAEHVKYWRIMILGSPWNSLNDALRGHCRDDSA